jgi:hypothetical protein
MSARGRIFSDYQRRLRELGWQKYLRTLFCWNLATLIVVVVVFPFWTILSWFNSFSPVHPVVLGIVGFLFLMRAVFHRRIGLLTDERDAFRVAAVLIVLAALGFWVAGGFQTVGEARLRALLGSTGVVFSYILPVLMLIITNCVVVFFPAFFIRGLEEPAAEWHQRILLKKV